MRNTVLILTEKRRFDADAPARLAVQQAVTAWLEKELRKPPAR